MYERLLEYYEFEKRDYDYTILRGRIAFTDTKIRLHHKSSSIVVTMNDLIIYVGDYEYAPDLSPVNVLRLLHKLHTKEFAKIKGGSLYKIHVRALKAYKDGYNLEGFRAFHAGENNAHSYRERLMTFTDNGSLSTYYMEVNAVNDKVGASIVNQTLTVDDDGKISSTVSTKTKMAVYGNNVMVGLTHYQIFDLFLQLDPVEDSIIMSRLLPYFRKRTIDEILKTIDDAP